jgi:hypothetical protein
VQLTAGFAQIPQADPDDQKDPQSRLGGRLGMAFEERVVIYTAAAKTHKNDTA